ncbi:phosphodiester glycosidase family protein [Defluviitalea phaphyphila]|uniref:phosphodiester glycosidase family protein n=1 Tax=Defluviitalea phaphyphila TaxID=1473580 RepID=UPI00073090E1|nr:phosphodiester glycosidase family protein [Defluviitalea phaphyphila]
MKKIYKIYISLFICLIINIVTPQILNASNVLYKEVKQEEVRKGVTYLMDRRLTEDGWLDIHILKVDLTNPYIKLDVMESTNEYNIKETLTDLIESNGAIGGVNGDFFDMSKNPTASLGMVIRDGNLISATNYVNLSENKWPTFFMDKEGNPFIDYCKVSMAFYNENNISFQVAGINKVTTFKKAVYLDNNAYTTTEQIDKINDSLYKIVVENDKIVYISASGETVSIPEDGYVIAIEESVAADKINLFKVGQTVNFELQTSIDLEKIETALGGAGKIVDKGTIPQNPGHLVAPNTRNPRTALGISKDGNTLYLVAVDGRSPSIGATHSEMTSLLLEYGIYDAIHLDGGGSTTIAARLMGEEEVTLLNNPSGGSQRKIVNGLGVFLDAPIGELAGIKLVPKYDRVFKNTGVEIEVIGYDENLNPVSINEEDIKWSVENITGKWNGNIFYPESSGEGIITAKIGDIKGEVSLISMEEPKALEINPNIIKLEEGERVELEVVGLDEEGYKVYIDPSKITWNVTNNLGKVDNGVFIAGNTTGQGVIEGSLGEIKVYVPVLIGEKVVPIESFEESNNVEWLSYPSYVTGEIAIDTSKKYEGNKSLKMNYSFKAKLNETQASYIQFTSPLKLDDVPKAIGMWVYGDGSKDWLRGRIIDSKGEKYVINFAENINWDGWKYVQADIPSGVNFPVSIERIYVVTLNNDVDRNNTIYVDHISGIYSLEENINNLPESTKLQDKYEKSLSKEADENSFDITIFGTTANKNTLLDEVVQREVIAQMNNSDFSIYAGETDINEVDIKVPYVKWNDKYVVTDINNLRIIQLSAAKGGIRNTDSAQWKYLQRDLDTDKSHIIIVMDKNPLNSSTFTDSMEAELFHNLLKQTKEEEDKNIFVISTEGYNTDIQIKEGIRYINLNGLWYKNDDINLYKDFSILRFRINDSQINYDLQSVYPQVIVD